MTMFMLNGQRLPLDIPFTAGDTQYPANWLRIASLEEKQAIGITEVAEAPVYDDRFYWGPGNPKDLDTLKAMWLGNVNQIAYTLLAQSDWMVTRKVETGIAIPIEWSVYRDQIRLDCVANKDLISQAVDVDALIAAVSSFVWARGPNQRGELNGTA